MASLRSHFHKSGSWLFAWRSYLPLALFPVVLVALRGYSYPYDSPALALAWEVACFAVGVAGAAIRAYTIGYAPPGSSGRTTDSPSASRLNTTGIYSLVRHPLYLGNFLMWLSIVLLTRHWWAVAAVSLAFWLYYERIMYAEEEFLRSHFGQSFDDWAGATPAIWLFGTGWRRRWKPSPVVFSGKAVLLREPSPWFAFIASFTLVEAAAEWFATGRPLVHPVWVFTLATVGGIYLLFQLRPIRSRLQRRDSTQ